MEIQDTTHYFWVKHRVLKGFDPEKPMGLKEKLYWKRIELQRNICKKSNNHFTAITLAAPFDKQYFLEKWWDKIPDYHKAWSLKHVWQTKGISVIYGYDWWLPYFKDTGFITDIGVGDGKATELYADQPTEPVTLYRGSRPEFKVGMPWTSNIEVAKTYRDQPLILAGERKIYKTEVQPESILAIFGGDFTDLITGESVVSGTEYVINHRHLSPDKIEVVEF